MSQEAAPFPGLHLQCSLVPISAGEALVTCHPSGDQQESGQDRPGGCRVDSYVGDGLCPCRSGGSWNHPRRSCTGTRCWRSTARWFPWVRPPLLVWALGRTLPPSASQGPPPPRHPVPSFVRTPHLMGPPPQAGLPHPLPESRAESQPEVLSTGSEGRRRLRPGEWPLEVPRWGLGCRCGWGRGGGGEWGRAGCPGGLAWTVLGPQVTWPPSLPRR